MAGSDELTKGVPRTPAFTDNGSSFSLPLMDGCIEYFCKQLDRVVIFVSVYNILKYRRIGGEVDGVGFGERQLEFCFSLGLERRLP